MDITKQNFDYYHNCSSYRLGYNYWVNNLFERISRLFVWENTGDDLHGGIDPIHIEKNLLLCGNTGITYYDGKLVSFAGSYSGVSIYYDRYPNYIVRSPLHSAMYTIGKDISIIRNNSNETSVQHLCHRYAVMLAHAEVTLTTLLVNARVSSVPTVNNNTQKALVDEWRSGVYNGKIGTILDSGFLSIKWQDINVNTGVNIKDIVEVRDNLLTNFYKDCGVKCQSAKKGNMIEAEVMSNDAMLLLNINDMLENRQRGAELVNDMYGTNWSVRKCDELQYEQQPEVKENVTDAV
ncbi:MAG: hypothetical protein MJZ20_12455 [Bacteroidaceae bacterium]|nr:hypothetical protein [Bacteroidaceae bacterium]